MSRKADLLIEIGCEELPAGQLAPQLELLAEGLASGLLDAGLIDATDSIDRLCTPRRLAVRIPAVRSRQADQVLERKGPAEAVAFDADGNPTRAAQGFARSVGRPVAELERVENEQGRWLFARIEQPGRTLGELLPDLFESTIRSMAGARSMRWSDRDDRFLRPVRWLVALHGDETIDLACFGLQAGRDTRGHRIHAGGWHEIGASSDYEALLEQLKVLVDPQRRRARIVEQARSLADQAGLQAVLDPALVEEVAGLTEWPVAVLGHFDDDFLAVPEEALICSLQQHQKSFALRDDRGRLASRFIAVANIESQDVALMTAGFERVVRPRLADARFFWDQDRRAPLATRREQLEQILFQEKLGSVGDKVRRIEQLVRTTAAAVNADLETALRAAGLCKCDLVTEMVGEFPELQGVMGRHYALASGEPEAVATAIESHYQPRQAGDALPGDAPGQALALADRLDTLLGAFAAGQRPRGGKDPFALRRAALGVVRLLEASDSSTTLHALLEAAAEVLGDTIRIDQELLEEVEQFIFERLRHWAAEQGIETNTVHAVAAGQPGSIADFMARSRAVQQVAEDPAMGALVAANKRASNLLKQAKTEQIKNVDGSLMQEAAESALNEAISETEERVNACLSNSDYPQALAALALLREPVDRFFDEVMVMCDDPVLQHNRLALLAQLRALFLRIADVARLGR